MVQDTWSGGVRFRRDVDMKPAKPPRRYANPDSLVSKRLLEGLIRFAHGQSFAETASRGMLRDMNGRPVLHCYSVPPITSKAEARLREHTRRWLTLAATDLDLLEARLNAVGVASEIVSPVRSQKGSRSRPQAGPGWIIPVVRQAQQWPIAVIAVALLTPIGDREQDVLANRVAKCALCRGFYLKKISVRGGCCSAKCRRMMAA